MDFLGFLITQCLNALSQASVLLFLACGLTLIFGIMRIINFAHGAIFMLGAYVGHTIVVLTGQFWLALIAAPLVVAGIGALFEMFLLSRLYARRDGGAYLMITFGLAIVLSEAVRLIWGAQPKGIDLPEVLTGVVFLLDQPFPIYRLFLIGLGVSASIALWQFLERTRTGLLIRAVSQNPEMVHALGTDIRIVRTGVFALGCGLAAFGGILATPLFGAYLAMGNNVVVDAFVIVIIGGMGSFLGSVIGSIMVGFVQVFGAYYFPSMALSLLYLLMLTVLIVRPGGLLGKEE
jgi:branched-chain amino acid transport system permease protein